MNEREKQNNCSEEHISLLDISDDRVDTEIRHWLPDIYTTTFDWLSDRPTMRINSEYITTIHKSKQKLNSQDRLRFYMGSINIEVAELILSNSQDNRERYYELGDISFFLSLLDFNRQQLEFVTLRPENILSTTTRSQIIGMNPEQSLLFVTEQLLKTSSPYNPVYDARESLRNEKIREVWNILTRFAIKEGWRLHLLVDHIAHKNDTSYPMEMFNDCSPFICDHDAVECIELFRHIDGYQNRATFYQDILALRRDNSLWMISGHSDTEHLRYHVNGRLVFITDSSDCNTSIKMRAQRLLDIGQWDDKPLDLPFPSIFISKKDFKTP